MLISGMRLQGRKRLAGIMHRLSMHPHPAGVAPLPLIGYGSASWEHGQGRNTVSDLEPISAGRRRRSMTARELARLLGVSQSTVSRAFTPGASIAPDLRTRIIEYAREVGYEPNAIASMLSKRRTSIIGIVVSELQNPFYPALIEKLSRELQRVGFQSLLFNVARGSNVEGQLAALRRYKVDGVIIISATILAGTTLSAVTEGLATVLINRIVDDTSMNCICCDNAAGGRAIAEHFHALGRRRVAYVAGLGHTITNMERQTSFITRVAELGMTLTHCINGGEYSYAAGYQAALAIAAERRTDAVFFANDLLAIGGLDAFRDDAGLRVPEDVAVAGFDDIGMAGWPHYQLTTFSQPIDDMVAASVGMLVDGSADPSRPRSILRLAGSLVVRRSTAGTAALSA